MTNNNIHKKARIIKIKKKCNNIRTNLLKMRKFHCTKQGNKNTKQMYQDFFFFSNIFICLYFFSKNKINDNTI